MIDWLTEAQRLYKNGSAERVPWITAAALIAIAEQLAKKPRIVVVKVDGDITLEQAEQLRTLLGGDL